MVKLFRRLMVLAAIGGAVGYFVKQRRQEDRWEADDPEGDWGVKQSNV